MKDLFLKGEIVSLRKPNIEKDILQGEWHQWFNDAEITKYLVHGLFPTDRESQKLLIEAELKRSDTLLLSIISNKTGKMIGVVSLKGIDYINRNAEIGMVLGFEKEPGTGLEAMALITQHGFDRLNLIKIHAGTYEEHWKWANILETIGYKMEGIRKNMMIRNGRTYDVLLIAIEKEDYYTLKERRGGKLIQSVDELYEKRTNINQVPALGEAIDSFNNIPIKF